MSKFAAFAALHVPGDPLVLYNVWDAGSAKAAERAGAKAIATGSWSVAAAAGYEDGEALPLEEALASAAQIARATALPVSIDFEGGYAVRADQVAANLDRLKATGAVGCNFEDQVIGGEGLHAVTDQAARIAAVRAAVGSDFFVNARTDIFLKAPRDTHDRAMLTAALERAHAYADAGANGFFAAGLVDAALIDRLCKASPLPVNIFAVPGAPGRPALADLGVARISHGPFPYRAALAGFEAGLKAALA